MKCDFQSLNETIMTSLEYKNEKEIELFLKVVIEFDFSYYFKVVYH